MKEEIENWLQFASEDLRLAELAQSEDIYNQVCFHAQQCAEKVLKAFILQRGKIHPQTHRLSDLLNHLGKNVFKELQEDIISLDRFYILTRYPDALPGSLPQGLPTKRNAEKALDIAKSVFKRAQEVLAKS